MSRPLRSAFIATVSTATLTACSSDGPILAGNPPQPTTVASATADVAPSATGTSVPPVPTASAPPTATPVPSATSTSPQRKPGALNPRDDEGRIVHLGWSGNDCFVYLPFPPLRAGEKRLPGTAPPRKPVTCPAEMKDPAYQSCKGGVVNLKRGLKSCECFLSGNPPRIQNNPCPSHD